MKQAALADGTILEFPDDTPDSVIQTAVLRLTQQGKPKDIPAAQSTLGDVANQAAAGIIRGAAQMPGIPADLANLVATGYDKAHALFTGATPEEEKAAIAERNRAARLPQQTLQNYGGQAFQ